MFFFSQFPKVVEAARRLSQSVSSKQESKELYLSGFDSGPHWSCAMCFGPTRLNPQCAQLRRAEAFEPWLGFDSRLRSGLQSCTWDLPTLLGRFRSAPAENQGLGADFSRLSAKKCPWGAFWSPPSWRDVSEDPGIFAPISVVIIGGDILKPNGQNLESPLLLCKEQRSLKNARPKTGLGGCERKKETYSESPASMGHNVAEDNLVTGNITFPEETKGHSYTLWHLLPQKVHHRAAILWNLRTSDLPKDHSSLLRIRFLRWVDRNRAPQNR